MSHSWSKIVPREACVLGAFDCFKILHDVFWQDVTYLHEIAPEHSVFTSNAFTSHQETFLAWKDWVKAKAKASEFFDRGLGASSTPSGERYDDSDRIWGAIKELQSKEATNGLKIDKAVDLLKTMGQRKAVAESCSQPNVQGNHDRIVTKMKPLNGTCIYWNISYVCRMHGDADLE